MAEDLEDYLSLPLHEIATDVYYELWNILGVEDGWKAVLREITKDTATTYKRLTEYWVEGQSRVLSERPSKIFLNEVSNLLCTVAQFIKWLERTDPLHPALLLLKPDEPLVIVKEPVESVTANSGSNSEVVLECQATGFPPPQYQWFHRDQAIEGANSSKLHLKRPGSSNQGEYVCAVSKIDRETDQLAQPVLYSRRSSVIIQEWNICLNGSSELSHDWDNNHWSDEQSNNLNGHNDLSPYENSRHYAEGKFAFLVGNDDYTHMQPLGLPSADVRTMYSILRPKGFKVMALWNLSLAETRNALQLFCTLINKGAYVVFYFVGHGFEDGVCYLQPIEASNKHCKSDSLPFPDVRNSIQLTEPKLAVFFLDICRTAPENRMEEEKLQSSIPVKAKGNILVAHATSPMWPALESSGSENGIYMTHLKKFLPDKRPIWAILHDVRRDMEEVQQIPWNEGNAPDDISLDDPNDTQNISELKIRKFEKLTGYPRPLANHLTKLDLLLTIKRRPLYSVFCNSVAIEVTVARRSDPSLPPPFQPIRFIDTNTGVAVQPGFHTPEKIYAVINGLQRLKGDLVVKLLMKSTEKNDIVVHLQLGRPMVASETL